MMDTVVDFFMNHFKSTNPIVSLFSKHIQLFYTALQAVLYKLTHPYSWEIAVFSLQATT